MKRTNVNKADAILTADYHLREDNPICRIDYFLDTQIQKMKFIQQLQVKHNCPVIHAGDLFNHWKASPYLITLALNYLPKNMFTVAGNHDLPNHNIDLLDKSALNTLIHAKAIDYLTGTHWGQEPKNESLMIGNRKILVWHVMTWKDNPPWLGCKDPTAKELLEEFPQCDLIVTGHNHNSFVEELNGRILVNPGSITRQTADQESYQPKVFLWYAKTNSVEPILIPIEKGVISREHIEHKEERDLRIKAFVGRLTNDWEVGVSFEANLERFQKENKIRSSVMQIVRAAIDTGVEK